tara:strand:- start:565 stop:786 length:222 start_codon:yes stop_codon:yes gene_type:complete
MIYTIKKEEILEYFKDVESSTIIDILETITKHCEDNDIPLLNNPSKSMQIDFFELIMDCLDLNLIFSEKNKLN